MRSGRFQQVAAAGSAEGSAEGAAMWQRVGEAALQEAASLSAQLLASAKSAHRTQILGPYPYMLEWKLNAIMCTIVLRCAVADHKGKTLHSHKIVLKM